MEEESILPELWFHSIFPAVSLREIARIARTSHSMHKLCTTFINQVQAPVLQALVDRLCPRKSKITIAEIWDLSRRTFPYGAVLCIPAIGVFRTHIHSFHHPFPMFVWTAPSGKAFLESFLINSHAFPVLHDALCRACLRLEIEHREKPPPPPPPPPPHRGEDGEPLPKRRRLRKI